MDLRELIHTNEEILRLIRDKHEDLFPGAKNTPEARYYRIIDKDNTRAREAMAHGGLALQRDNTIYRAPV